MATPLRRNRVGLKAFWRPTAPWRQLLEATAAATIAWVIALRIFEHPDPFFAPIAAVVSLNATVGERGRETVRLLLGVIIGISIGEVTVAVMASSALPLALATLAAMATARLLGGGRMVIVQAASGAILTVASANGAGYNRLLDALLGGGVALVFTQLLFTPDPIRLLRRAESAVLDEMADALDVTARGLAHDRDDLAEEAMQNLRGLRDRLSELARTRDASGQVARQSAAWRAQRIPLVQETEDAGHLDLLGGSCLMLTRTAFAVTAAERRALVPTVEHLAAALATLADDPGDRENRQRAVNSVLDAARALPMASAAESVHGPATSMASTTMLAQMVAVDIMIFAGVTSSEATEIVAAGAGEPEVPEPPIRRRWFSALRRRERG